MSEFDPMREAEAEAEALIHGRRFLRSCYRGVVHLDGESAGEIRFIRDPTSGRLLVSCPVALFFAEEVVLFVPDEAEDAMKLLLSAEQIDEGARTDRWMAYHGESPHVRWGECWVDSAKHGPWVFDGDALMEGNTLAEEEGPVLKTLNADRGRLADLVQRVAGIDLESPVAVGADQWGMDVRARFEPVRLEFGEEIGSAAALETWMGSGATE